MALPGSCGLVGLGWEHAKTMCMCIPPSKTQRDTNPTPDSVRTCAPVVKTCWQPAVLILGRRESSRKSIAPWWGLGFCSVSWLLLFGPESSLLSDAFARICAEAGMGELWTNPRKREGTTPKSVK